jgi:hypothetical protein
MFTVFTSSSLGRNDYVSHLNYRVESEMLSSLLKALIYQVQRFASHNPAT